MIKRFEGYRATPFLWEGSLLGLRMFEVAEQLVNNSPELETTPNIRLGKWVEQFVWFELEQDDTMELLETNLQVFQDKTTIGELDCLLKQSGKVIHVEIVYKFYLYDPALTHEMDRWIGPNRRDSLVQKLQKLKEKQFPLLFHPETQKLLKKSKIDTQEVKQETHFKAQLFVPYEMQEASFLHVNNDCVKGFYIRYADLTRFENFAFYIPDKLDWLVEPHLDIDWLTLSAFQPKLSELLTDKKSPLCWMKSPNDELQKFFVVWWA